VVDRFEHIGIGTRAPMQWLGRRPRHARRLAEDRGAARLRSDAKQAASALPAGADAA
jgi:hypothetical protein